jgi:hypothetical protein
VTLKLAALSLAGLAALSPFVARRRLFVCAALCWSAYGLWELRGSLWRGLGALWRCFTPASRVAAAVLVGFALTSFPPWVDAPIVAATVLATSAINRRREARRIQAERRAIAHSARAVRPRQEGRPPQANLVGD